MEEVRQLVQEEGREARNLVAFHVAVDTPARISRKPPRAAPPARRLPPRSAARLRSASAGRDKRSELRARYWALLFGDLQRSIGEIYNTVEAHENLNECQEVILVLENYTRDFKALGEWFRLKWEYDNTPPPQRPQSLAWEIRKTDFVRPESRRAQSVKSSPSVSGKNSPLLSGHNTPSGKNSPITGKLSPGSGKISPRMPGQSSTSPKANIEFFSTKCSSKMSTKPEPKAVKDTKLAEIKEKEIKENLLKEHNVKDSKKEDIKDCKLDPLVVEIGKAKECPNISPKQVVIKSAKHAKMTSEQCTKVNDLTSQAKATTAKLDEMENDFLGKHINENNAKNENLLNQDKEFEITIGSKADESSPVTIDEKTVQISSLEAKDSSIESPIKSDDNFADISDESSPTTCGDDKLIEIAENKEELKDIPEEVSQSTVESKVDLINLSKIEIDKVEAEGKCNNVTEIMKNNEALDETSTDQSSDLKDTKELPGKDNSNKEDSKNTEIKTTSDPKPSRPAYSQAAAKPKSVTSKLEVKTPVRSAPAVRNKNVVELPNTVSKTRQFPKKNQTGKCSYPFNLTTGRTSLFDGTQPVVKVAKKAIRNVQIGSGDAKSNQIKTELKKRPLRPTSLKINEKLDEREKSNTTLENIKDFDEYSSTDTIVTQIDMSRIESSESLKTLVPEELLMLQDGSNSIEVLSTYKNDNEGWLTVKSRRLSRESKKQSKSHWANRFDQPSATTSLPTLNMISPKQETNPITVKTEKLDRAKSEQPEKRKPDKVKVVVKPKSVYKVKDPAMIRQKSDVTGLKTHSRNKARKTEKVKDLPKTDGELLKNRLHSSLESLTTGLERSQESTEEAFDFDKWKAEFKSTFKYLDEEDQIPNHNEILKSADPSEMSEIAEMTSQIEENEKKISWALDFQSDVDQKKLCEEEDLLNRQIMELQQVSDIDLDTETDDTETDAEILCEESTLAVPSCQSPETLGALAASLEDRYETALAGMSWAERVDTLVVLEALVARDPGRAQQLHAKLSQGIKRRGSFQDALRRLQAKQARAERQRQEYQTERARKIHQLLGRVEEVKVAKNQLIEEKRLRMERRLQKAAENRDQHLKDIVRKAHDEEEKLREIAFIKHLEAENRRHDFLSQFRSHTARLRLVRRDRLCKLEQKAAREAAVGARRQALEAARQQHVATLLERRRERDARVEGLKELKKQERDDAAREKAEGVKSRLSALAAAAELEAHALRSRIRDKQDASQLRLESHLQAIRERATGPRAPTTSESQDQSSKEERELEEEAERIEQERRERERQKAIKKKARKVRQKLLSASNDSPITEDISQMEPNAATHKLYKVINQLNNILAPLLATENNDNGRKCENNDNATVNNKKNGKLNNIVNGIDNNKGGERKKSNKKRKGSYDTINDANNSINDIDNSNLENNSTEIIIEKENTPDSVHSVNKDSGEKRKSNKKKKNNIDVNVKDTGNNTTQIIVGNLQENTESVKIVKDDKKKFNNNRKRKDSVDDSIEKDANNFSKKEIIIENLQETTEPNKTDKTISNSINQKRKDSDDENINRNNLKATEATYTTSDSVKNETDKMKNKKNKANKEQVAKTDRPSLMKAGSICSSISDTSKASWGGDRKAKVNIDVVFLERQLNELHRIMEKFDKTSRDKSASHKAHGMKVVAQLLAVAADREDVQQQLSVKCLTTAVHIVSRIILGCAASAARVVSTSLCVHMVKLLSNQLEKDLHSDQKEIDLARQLCECLCAALDSVLCSTRLYEERREGIREETAGELAALRARAHTLISYLCLCGCVSRAESAGEAQECVQALVTVCADLCQPCDTDVGPELPSATQSLRCALGASLCGARAELCALFADAALASRRARGTARLLRAIARLEPKRLQESFGEGGWPLEFRAAVARLLSQHAPNDKEAPRTGGERESSRRLERALCEAMVLDLVELVGFVVVGNPQMQETICDGWSVIKTLCTLPANWLVSKTHSHALLPTLIALAEWPSAAAAIGAELSMEMLEEYLESPEAQKVKLVQVIKQGRAKQNSVKK